MKITIKSTDVKLPLMDRTAIKRFVELNCLPGMLNLEEELGDYGISNYHEAEVVDVAVLNELLYEFSDLSDEEFQIICAILEKEFAGDLSAIPSAFLSYQNDAFDFIPSQQADTESYEKYLSLGYTQTKMGFLRMR